MENKPMISETEKREALKHFMAEKAKAPVCVAFSGGVDSSLILKLACDTAKKTDRSGCRLPDTGSQSRQHDNSGGESPEPVSVFPL